MSDLVNKDIFKQVVSEKANELFNEAESFKVDANDPNVEFKVRKKFTDLERTPSIYFLLSEEDKLLYVGKSKSLSNRLVIHVSGSSFENSGKYYKLISSIRFITFESMTTRELNAVEKTFISSLRPAFNGSYAPNVFGYESLYEELKSRAVRGEDNTELAKELLRSWQYE